MKITLQAGGTVASVQDSMSAQLAHAAQENPTAATMLTEVGKEITAFFAAKNRPGDAGASAVVGIHILLRASAAESPSEHATRRAAEAAEDAAAKVAASTDVTAAQAAAEGAETQG